MAMTRISYRPEMANLPELTNHNRHAVRLVGKHAREECVCDNASDLVKGNHIGLLMNKAIRQAL